MTSGENVKMVRLHGCFPHKCKSIRPSIHLNSGCQNVKVSFEVAALIIFTFGTFSFDLEIETVQLQLRLQVEITLHFTFLFRQGCLTETQQFQGVICFTLNSYNTVDNLAISIDLDGNA